MLVAGLLSSDQLAAIFLNADELIQVNAHFSEVLREAIGGSYFNAKFHHQMVIV